MTYTTHGYWYGPGTPKAPQRAKARCGGPGMCATCSTEAAAPGEPAELRDLPPEVIRLVHAVDRMRDHWAEAALSGQRLSDRQQELWRELHGAADAVWGRYEASANS